MWGSQRWWCAKKRIIIGTGWQGFFGNQAGELVAFYTPDNIPPWLSKEVVELLCNTAGWRIVPLDAGRVLRFEDSSGVGMEFRHDEKGTDLEEILRAVTCSAYRMVQREKMKKISGERDYTQGERDALKNEREQTWQWLCGLLNQLRGQIKIASRPPTKIVALETIDWVLLFLNEQLPANHSLRSDYGVGAEELERVRGALATERGKVERRGGPSPRPSPTAGRGE